MSTFKIKFSDFYQTAAGVDQFGTVVGKSKIFLCEKPVSQLIARYALHNKTVLSLGAGNAFEEYWMGKSNAKLTLVDLYPEEQLLQHLKVCALPAENAESEVLTYTIDDAIEYCKKSICEYDVVYVSSMHPDEIRREEIQANFIANRTEASRLIYLTWPKGFKPYSEYVTAAWRLVRDQGVAVMQHYRGGVDVLMQPHYLDDMRNQMAEYGLSLIEVFCFKNSPQHLLVIALKGTEEQAHNRRLALKSRPSITTFHGRYPDEAIRNEVLQVYPTAPLGIQSKWLGANAIKVGFKKLVPHIRKKFLK